MVVIVFQEGNKPFLASSISSKMVHVILIVRKLEAKNLGSNFDCNSVYYSLSVIRKDSVPSFAPVLPNYSIHKKCAEFKANILSSN